MQADNGGVVNLNGGTAETPNTITTIADGSIGVHAASAGDITIVGPTTISTGSYRSDQLPRAAPTPMASRPTAWVRKVTLNAATTVTTLGTDAFGLDAYGLYASNGGTIDGSLAPTVGVTTSGTGAIGVYATGRLRRLSRTASTIMITGATVETNGANRRPACWPILAGR